MSRSVLARFTPFAAICLGAASPVRAASEPGILDLTGVAHVQDELALGGRGVTLAVVGTAADTVALAAVVSEVAPDADVLSLAAGESIDSEVDVVVFADPADATSAVVDALAGRGVSVIVPMGDAGRGAALSTSALAHALRVAATAGPGRRDRDPRREGARGARRPLRRVRPWPGSACRSRAARASPATFARGMPAAARARRPRAATCCWCPTRAATSGRWPPRR
ncbi:MAG: hypothetical protein U1F43_24465 [Myxococcota bacterium]